MKPSDVLRVQTLLPPAARRHAYIPVTATDLVDSAANTWNGAARNTGTYTFRPGDNGDLWPRNATGVVILLYGAWATANVASIMSARRTAAGANEVQVRSQVDGFGLSVNGICALDSSGYFYVVIANANAAGAIVRVLGYLT